MAEDRDRREQQPPIKRETGSDHLSHGEKRRSEPKAAPRKPTPKPPTGNAGPSKKD